MVLNRGTIIDGKEKLFADMQVADYLGIGLAIALGYLVLTPIAEKRQGTLLPVVFCLAFGGLAPLADAAGWITLTFLCAAVSEQLPKFKIAQKYLDAEKVLRTEKSTLTTSVVKNMAKACQDTDVVALGEVNRAIGSIVESFARG